MQRNKVTKFPSSIVQNLKVLKWELFMLISEGDFL